ncbi:MAG: hypothetical protein U1F34_04260 [Gammaproteobacteria bacterium]
MGSGTAAGSNLLSRLTPIAAERLSDTPWSLLSDHAPLQALLSVGGIRRTIDSRRDGISPTR